MPTQPPILRVSIVSSRRRFASECLRRSVVKQPLAFVEQALIRDFTRAFGAFTTLDPLLLRLYLAPYREGLSLLVLLGACVGGAACPSHGGRCSNVVNACDGFGGVEGRVSRGCRSEEAVIYQLSSKYPFFMFLFNRGYLLYPLPYLIFFHFYNLCSGGVSRRPSHG